MKFREFCELALSNDIICIVDDIVHGKPLRKSVAAFQFILDDGHQLKPEWANEVLDKEVESFTYGKIASDYKHTHLIVKLR